MTVQYDRSIPVLDNHCHICFPQPINQSLTDYEALFNRLAVSRAGLLSCPSSSHTENGVDPLENLKILYLKENLSVPCFAYAGFTWHQSDPQAYADFGQTMLDMGFDGFKTLEQHPRVRKMTGKGLSDPSFGKFFAFANRTGSVMVCQILQGLEIGNGMVQPGTVQTAVEDKLPVAQLKTPADCQHGIGIVLLHREHIGPLWGIAQGIEISQNFMGCDAQFFRMDQAAVGSQQKVILLQRLHQFVKTGSTENNTGSHFFTSLSSTVYHTFPKRESISLDR